MTLQEGSAYTSTTEELSDGTRCSTYFREQIGSDGRAIKLRRTGPLGPGTCNSARTTQFATLIRRRIGALCDHHSKSVGIGPPAPSPSHRAPTCRRHDIPTTLEIPIATPTA